jgi:hypothetical protein
MSHHRPRSPVFAAVLTGFSWISAGLFADIQPDDYSPVDRWLEPRLDGLVDRYEMLHSRPELSEWEVETAAMVARRLRVLGYTVHEGIGGHGVAGVLSNGAGPTLCPRGASCGRFPARFWMSAPGQEETFACGRRQAASRSSRQMFSH